MIDKIFAKPDRIGVFSSVLCLLHCIITPLIFIIQPIFFRGETSMIFWWKGLDIIFLILSLIAVYFSSRNTSKQWVSYTLWLSWFTLTLVILNEKLTFYHLPEVVVFIPTIGLIVLHIYNQKYCKCK